MTQEQLAAAASVDRSYLGKIEVGDVLEPGADTVRRVATALAVPLRALAEPLGWYEDEQGQDWEGALVTKLMDEGASEEEAVETVRAIRMLLARKSA